MRASGRSGVVDPRAVGLREVGTTVLPDTGSGVTLALLGLGAGSFGAGVALVGRRRPRRPTDVPNVPSADRAPHRRAAREPGDDR